ncbi:MAG: RNA polymerase sigma factor, partial [Bacteroidales bacterium]|nr:RNA polymerase sigma factor [Bacteroidales bacterium]
MENSKFDKIRFEQIVKDHHLQVFRTAMGFVHVREEAEDIAQDVFVRAYKSIENFRGDSSVSTWLYRIAVNVSLNYIAQKKRNRIFQYSHDTLKRLFDRQEKTKTPLQELEIADRERIVREAIDELPEKQRIAFVLSRYDDLPQKEIATIMELSEGAVEQLLQRAKVKLQKR